MRTGAFDNRGFQEYLSQHLVAWGRYRTKQTNKQANKRNAYLYISMVISY